MTHDIDTAVLADRDVDVGLEHLGAHRVGHGRQLGDESKPTGNLAGALQEIAATEFREAHDKSSAASFTAARMRL